MRLYVEEIKADPLTQNIAVLRKMQLARIRLHLCKYRAPAGTFTLTVVDADAHTVATASLTIAEMEAAGSAVLQANYWHGYISFVFDSTPTLKAGNYTLTLTAAGYTFAEDEFLGWCKSWEDPSIALTDEDSPTPANAAYDFEFYTVQRVR